MITQSIEINTLQLNNRLVMPPMATAKSTPEGYVTDALCDYYKQRAAGGYIGLIITEHSFITGQGKASNGQLSIADDNALDGLKHLTDAIHQDGTKVIAQINHAGSSTTQEITGLPIVSASAVLHPWKRQGPKDELPRALSKEEILALEELYVQAAVRAKQAGYDGVEIHSAHGYLLNQFYSPLTNHRTDEYGSSTIENRTRMQVEIIRKVRDAVGANYPIALRLGGCDYAPGGSTIADAVDACVRFQQAGVDLLDISGGMFGYVRKDNTEPGYFGDMTEQIKKAVSIPVILTGGVQTIGDAEALLEQNKADLIGVGRALLKDADWARKALEERR